ncbi:MAG: hypothetical protein CVT74_13125 [Alphaproteobacteria bacterium HGW-Alphaproteobacteria-13]|nr:MAG: hypothetical protein CVT74_13125 [Alphaproteobacteria bacterium HGW-Alphaproteobacteria-13]
MNRQTLLERISEEFYQGELFGEGVFAAYYAAETDPGRKLKLANLLQLETETKARLRPFLVKLGLDLAEKDISAVIKNFADAYPAKSWKEHMQELAHTTEEYLGKFKEVEAHTSGYERQMAHVMVTHEAALLNFARLELAGEGDRSLDDVVQQLHWPIQ